MSENGKTVVQEILDHADMTPASKGLTVQEVYDSMTEEQQAVVHYFVGLALQESVQESS